MTLEPAGPVVVLHQQVRPTLFDQENTTILVSENFFQKNDRYKHEDGLKMDKFVSGEFYAHTLYGGQVVITNPTSTPRPIDLLVQIPEGAVIASGSQETDSMPLDLAAFSTQTYEYFFYFPTAGEFTHFPAHVSTGEKVLAVAGPVEFNVVDRPLDVDESSWAYISQNGTDDEVIRYLNTNNIQRTDLNRTECKLQFDYCDAYINFYLEQPGSAMTKAEKWKDYPVLHWRNRFRNIIAQANEIETGMATVTDRTVSQ